MGYQIGQEGWMEDFLDMIKRSEAARMESYPAANIYPSTTSQGGMGTPYARPSYGGGGGGGGLPIKDIMSGMKGLGLGSSAGASAAPEMLGMAGAEAAGAAGAGASGAGGLLGGLCCFIFIAAQDGLDPIVRAYRDEHMTDRNRRGYYRLADILVPMMKRFRWVKALVKLFMVNPMVSYGKRYYGRGKVGAVFAPVAGFWLILFDVLGMRKPYRRKGTWQVV